MNKNGRACKKCNGTGQLDKEYVKEVMKIIEEEVSVYTPITLQKLLNKSSINKKEEEVKQTVHEGTKCNKCGVSPILGTRYRCYECEELNFCEICELSADSHSKIHPVIKITSPELDPLKFKKQA